MNLRKYKGMRTTAVLAAAFLFLTVILSLGGFPRMSGDAAVEHTPPKEELEEKSDVSRPLKNRLPLVLSLVSGGAVKSQSSENPGGLGGTLKVDQAATGSERQGIGFLEEPIAGGYELSDTYLVVKGDATHMRTAPTINAPVAATLSRYEKLVDPELVAAPDGTLWYQACFIGREGDGTENGERTYGFISGQVVDFRTFQYAKMLNALNRGAQYLERGKITYVSNYRNYHGEAPAYHGTNQDAAGGRRSQSAPGYQEPSNQSDFQYVEDGTLVLFLGRTGDFVHVERVSDGTQFYIPKQYIPVTSALTAFAEVIVIDKTNQNEAVFERRDGRWCLISKTLATTGANGEFHVPTPTGYFLVMEKRERFYYLKDGTDQVQGYAPYALRFAGGAYVHGVSTGYQTQGGKRADPGIREYSRTMGTVPLSHKCVRNYTSHAKFLYDWFEPGKTAVIVID